MRLRQLGKSGVRVSEIGLGTWEMSGDEWGKKDDAVSLRALEVGVEGGANFIDTAATYGQGHVERLVGRFLRGSPLRREEVVIATKVKPKCGEWAPPPSRNIRECFDRSWIRSECEASLKRVGTDYMDVLLLHTWSRGWDHETEWHEELSRLKAEGKIRSFGISIPDETITDANVQVALGLVDVIQCVFNVFQQEPLYSLFPLAAKRDVGIVARSPFSSGVIVQDWATDMRFPEGDWRGSWPLSVKPGWLEDQIRMANIVKPLLRATGLTYAEAALQFVLASPEVSSVVPGSAAADHVAENIGAARAALPSDALEGLRQMWIRGRVRGTYAGSI